MRIEGTKKEIRKISLLIESLKVGGFVTAEMDIREDSAITTNAAKEIISKIYDESTSISDAINLIDKRNDFDLSNLKLNDASREVINTFETVKITRKKYGASSINTWIVAMTGSSDDLSSIAFLTLLTKTVESKKICHTFRIVPLLETIDDLKNAKEILRNF